MIKFILSGHAFVNEVQTSIQIFYQNLHYYQTDTISNDCITIESIYENGISTAKYYNNGILTCKDFAVIDDLEKNIIKEQKRVIKEAIYKCLSKVTNKTMPWGMLTGIRPAKIYREMLEEGYSENEIFNYLNKKYYVSEKKILLSKTVAEKENIILNKYGNNNEISVYIGIPFCPTRCLYCSFSSYTLGQYKNKVDLYVDTLIKEIQAVKAYTDTHKIQTIYIGGGTPTSLNELQLEKLLSFISSTLDLSNLKEYTIEAGRPDTITKEKLSIIKKYGATRISINPQTMNEQTLKLIGRNHTAENFKEAFYYARELGHKNINTDLILGLPKEDENSLLFTLSEIKKLNPENVTFHTLAVKRASKLKENFDDFTLTDPKVVENMLAISDNFSKDMNMFPYYMYRQKNMVGGLENVGYSKLGFEGIYNIQIMEEKQTILSFGSGAVTKKINGSLIERAFNVKDVTEYIQRIDEMIERKRKLLGGF